MVEITPGNAHVKNQTPPVLTYIRPTVKVKFGRKNAAIGELARYKKRPPLTLPPENRCFFCFNVCETCTTRLEILSCIVIPKPIRKIFAEVSVPTRKSKSVVAVRFFSS